MKAPTLATSLRRAHLYAGLFLAPWVLMYGVSGFVFNHWEWFADDGAVRWKVDPSVVAHRLDADEFARRVLAALDDLADAEDATATWQMSPDSVPVLQGEITVQGADDRGGTAHLLIDPAGDDGRTFRTPPPIAPRTYTLAVDLDEPRRAAREALVARATAADPELRGMRFGEAQFPALALRLERGGERWNASYDPQSGVLTLSDPAERRLLRPSEFLTRMHVSHGYPSGGGAHELTTVRAIFVDAMACALCFWAVSGLSMWWQLKRQRRSGWVVLVATLVVVGIVWRGMYGLFTG